MAKPKNGNLGALLAAGGLWVWHNRDRIREILKSEQVDQALRTPQAQRLLNSPTAQRLAANPQLRTLIAHPEFQRWLNGGPTIQGQATTPPTPAASDPQEPYTGETRRL